jgi:hypothetical protein
MSAKHTPGPLEVISNLVRTPMSRGGFLVADFRDAYGQPHNDEAKANAALFVAVPDLLHALRDARGLLALHGCPVDWIDAALLKATGSAAA